MAGRLSTQRKVLFSLALLLLVAIPLEILTRGLPSEQLNLVPPRTQASLMGGAKLKDGTVKPADLIVLATGFVTQEVMVGKILGDEVAKKVGPVWGIAPDGEMHNMWKRTAQEGLWFVGGGFANCRVNSRHVALQIKAIEEGLLSKQWEGPPTDLGFR
jgi:hypothetical protein